jgi:hypothetical protein
MSEIPLPPSPTKNHANSLLLAGSILIVIAIFTVVTTGWQSYTPFERVFITLLPLIALYAIAWNTQHKTNLEIMSRYSMLTGSIIFPFVLGVAVYQLQASHVLNSRFYFEITAISSLWYLFIEFVFKKHEHAPLSIVFLILAGYFLADSQSFTLLQYVLAGMVLSVLFMAAAFQDEKHGHRWQADGYAKSGILIGTASLLMLPPALTDGTNYSGISNYTTGLYVLVGLLFVAIAGGYSSLWKRYRYLHLYEMRVLCENIAPVVIIGSTAVNALYDTTDTIRVIILILSSALALAASSFLKVRAFRTSGQAGVVFGIFLLVIFSITQLQAIWPILLLICGFLLIAGAYVIQKVDYRAFLNQMNRLPDTSLFDLGEKDNEGALSHNVTLMSPIIIILALILGYFFLIALIGVSSARLSYSGDNRYPVNPYITPLDSPYPTAYPTPLPTPTPMLNSLQKFPDTGWVTTSQTHGLLFFDYLRNPAIPANASPGGPVSSDVYRVDDFFYLIVTGIENQDPKIQSAFTNDTNIMPNPSSPSLQGGSSSGTYVNTIYDQSYGVVNGYVSRTITANSTRVFSKTTEVLVPKGVIQIKLIPAQSYPGFLQQQYRDALEAVQAKVAHSIIAH